MLQFILVFMLQERGPRQNIWSGQQHKYFKLCCLLLLKMFSENRFLASLPPDYRDQIIERNVVKRGRTCILDEFVFLAIVTLNKAMKNLID